jgi:hypothetical protein
MRILRSQRIFHQMSLIVVDPLVVNCAPHGFMSAQDISATSAIGSFLVDKGVENVTLICRTKWSSNAYGQNGSLYEMTTIDSELGKLATRNLVQNTHPFAKACQIRPKLVAHSRGASCR